MLCLVVSVEFHKFWCLKAGDNEGHYVGVSATEMLADVDTIQWRGDDSRWKCWQN